MSDGRKHLPPAETEPPPQDSGEPDHTGPNLTLLYTLLALALAAAIAFAIMIVLPFYHRSSPL